MDRPRSTSKSLPFSSCSPSTVPTPLSIPTPHGMRRNHMTPTSTLLDGELSLSKLERLSPNQQRTPTNAEAGTPRLAAAVSEAKRTGASAPSPSYADIPMDQFDRLLARNIRLSSTPSQTPPTAREDTSSPNVARAVHTVIADEAKRRELLLGLQKLFSDAKGSATNTHQGGKSGGSRNGTPRHMTPPAQQEATLQSLSTIAKAAREVSPIQYNDRVSGAGEKEWQIEPNPSAFTHAPKKGICRPKPTERAITSKLFEEALALRQPQTSQKVIKSEMSAFSETTESSSLTSYSTNKSAKATKSGLAF